MWAVTSAAVGGFTCQGDCQRLAVCYTGDLSLNFLAIPAGHWHCILADAHACRERDIQHGLQVRACVRACDVRE